MPRTTCFAWIALATGLAVAAGCGDAATSTTDAGDDHADGTAETPDATPEADAPTDVTVPDELPDEPAEVPDVEPDAAPDGPADAPADEPTDGEAGPGEVRVTMTDSDAWANLMPGGSSYHATFTLEVDNRSATDVTGFSVADGAVSLLSGAATLFRFTRPALTLAGGGPFDGRVAAGTTVRLEGNGMSAPASSGHCGAEVKVQVRVAWTGGPSTREVSGDTITLDCVY